MKKRFCSLEHVILEQDELPSSFATSRLIDGSPCGEIDMVIQDLDLEPKIGAMMRDFLKLVLKTSPCFKERFTLMLLEHQDAISKFCSPSWWKELSKEMSSKILQDVGLDPRTKIRGKSIHFAPTGWCRITEAPHFPIGELNGVSIALVAGSWLIVGVFYLVDFSIDLLLTLWVDGQILNDNNGWLEEDPEEDPEEEEDDEEDPEEGDDEEEEMEVDDEENNSEVSDPDEPPPPLF
ncbi:hypothetical protein Tco_1179219, partial [Tanacetum coccineum]